MRIFGWHVSFYRVYCLKPFFWYEGRYYDGKLKNLEIGPVGVRLSRLRSDLNRGNNAP